MNPEISSTERPVDALTREAVLARAAAVLQPPLRKWLENPRRRALRDVLHGTFLGHPLHPLLTDVPVGAWTVTAVCDVLELLGWENRATHPASR